jgi:hypothetical protein
MIILEIMPPKSINMEGNNLPIREFKLEWLCDNPSIALIAKRGSGKSWVCQELIKFFMEDRRYPGSIIIAPTDKMTEFYSEHFPDLYIHYKYKSEIIQKVLFRQEKIIEKEKTKAKEGKKINPRMALLMDDCLGDASSWKNDPPVEEMLFNGRHYKITYILTMQDPKGVPPKIRGNFDYIFMLADDFHSKIKKMHEEYAGMFPTLALFKTVFKELTKKYGCMVIVNRGSRDNLLDKVFWFKSTGKTLTDIKCRQFKHIHSDNYDPEWRKHNRGTDYDDILNGGKKKTNSGFTIEKV